METVIQQLLIKFNVTKKIIDKINFNFNIDQSIYTEYDTIETDFVLNICPKYLLSYIEKTNKNIIQDNSHYLVINDFSNELNKLFNKIIKVLENNKIDIIDNMLVKKSNSKKKDIIIDLQYLFNIFLKNIPNETHPQIVNYNKCLLCNNIMVTCSNKSELNCYNCGMVRELIGTVFDDTQFYNQEGQRAKSGTFNPNRHFQFWWLRILAREQEDELGDKKDPYNLYGEKTLKDIKYIVKRDKKILQLLNVYDIRLILRELGKTELNKNVPLILKKLTGIGPPNVPDHITNQVENIFTKAIEVGEKIKQNRRINRNYYPYYIYRIIEYITQVENIDLRRILFYIYIQSKDTVESDDLDWEKICKELKEVEYKPTDRTLGSMYNLNL